MSTYAKRRPAVTAGDEIANEALRLLGKVDLARVSAPSGLTISGVASS